MGKSQREGHKARPAAVMDDQRFQAMYHDPRFEKFPRKQQKVVIDPRFQRMFHDESFKLSAPVDKRGRKVKWSRKDEGLHRYYRQGDEGPADDPDGAGLQHDKQDVSHAADRVRGQSKLEQAAPSRRQGEKVNKARPRSEHVDAAAEAISVEHEEGSRAGKRNVHDREVSKCEANGEEASEGEEDGGASGGEDEEGASEGEGGASSTSDEGTLSETERAARRRWRLMRGLEAPSSASDDDTSSADWSDDEGAMEEDLTEWGAGAMAANPNEDVPEGEESRRLAVVDLDWSQVRAVDILAVLASFCGKDQTIEKVTVYLSDYGKECVAEEARRGPALFWKAQAAKANSTPGVNPRAAAQVPGDPSCFEDDPYGASHSQASSDDAEDEGLGMDQSPQEESTPEMPSGSSEEEDVNGLEKDTSSGEEEDGVQGRTMKGRAGREGRAGNQREGKGGDAQEAEFDARQLQLYERSKLRYYYAVVECNSVDAAVQLYEQCNGLELLRSANLLDLRYIGDDQSFEGREVRDEATCVPAGYEPPNFQTAALQQTRVQLTWDAEDTSRKAALRRLSRLTKEQVAEENFKAYLASESEEEEEASGGGVEAYRALLQEANEGAKQRAGGKDWAMPAPAHASSTDEEDEGEGARGASGGAEREVDMEVVFRPGLDELSQRLAARGPARKGEAKIAKDFVRRKREEAAAARLAGRRHLDSDAEASDDDGANSDISAERAAAADDFFQHEEDPFSDPFFQDGPAAAGRQAAGAGQEAGKARDGEARKARAEDKRRAAQQAQRQKDELGLLLLDDSSLHELAASGGQLAPDMAGPAEGQQQTKKRASLKERARAKKLSRKAEREAGSDNDEVGVTFTANLEDPRFKALLTSPEYALDPTDPRYRKASGLAEQLAKRSKKRLRAETGPTVSGPVGGAISAGGAIQGELSQLQLMVAHLKRKGRPGDRAQGKQRESRSLPAPTPSSRQAAAAGQPSIPPTAAGARLAKENSAQKSARKRKGLSSAEQGGSRPTKHALQGEMA